jgi:hypothetical protein
MLNFEKQTIQKIVFMAEGAEYAKAMMYEIFIRRAFKTDRHNPRYKGDVAFMTNLIDSENRRSNVAHLPSFEKQLAQIKTNINKAIDKFLSPSWRLTQEEKDELFALKKRLVDAYSSSQVLEIVNAAVELTNKYKGK